MSSIKGGGRAALTSEAEESIISLLYDLRDDKNPLLPKKSKLTFHKQEGEEEEEKKEDTLYKDLSDHDRKRERKRFLKKLLKFHNRVPSSNKLKCHNHVSSSNKLNRAKTARSGDGDASVPTVARTNSSGNVRIEFVEAIFKDEKKKKSKSNTKSNSKSSKKEEPAPAWKEGRTRKTMVLARSTTTADVMSRCKSKLKMKRPTRIFFVDKDSKLETDLIHDLNGMEDGSVVYVTGHAPKRNVEDGTNENDETEGETAETPLVEDPLELVKKAYRTRGRRRTNAKAGRGSKRPWNERLPPFGDSLERLEPLSEARARLPAAAYRSDILKSLDSSRVIVISGATGCGKSTQVPQFILEGMKAIDREDQANIIVTQPRRVAATSLAKRVSEERNLPPPGKEGSEVGYSVRLAKARSKDTKLVYCTVGVLLRMTVNPMESYGDELEDSDDEDLVVGETRKKVPLSAVSHVIIDEVHERDLTTDFALTLLRPLLSVNKRISIILMSATASAKLFVDFFRDATLGIEPKVFNIPGRTFPVETRWLEDCEEAVSGRLQGWSSENDPQFAPDDDAEDRFVLSPRVQTKIDNIFIAKLIKSIAQPQWNEDVSKKTTGDKIDGSVLVFLPGKGEISALSQMLYKDPQLGNKFKCSILQLHSTLTPSEQWRAFQPVKYGIVKIVLSTNVAETSITIPDISVVIDTGRVKEMRFNPSTRIKELVTVWTSQASSKQRAGRAGRTGPGTCYKLYTHDFVLSKMPLRTSPEIVRTPLEELILQVCLLEEQNGTDGTSPIKFLANAPEPPPKINLEQASSHLLEVGALTRIPNQCHDLFRLTPLGYHLSHLPMDPKVGKILVVGCVLQCIEPALTIAATLSSSKTCWLSFIPGEQNSRQAARERQEELIRRGFGGAAWPNGGVKGDLIGAIAAYNAWASSADNSKPNPDRQRRGFASRNALDHNALTEIKGLRSQFRDALRVAGLLQSSLEVDNIHGDDALLTSCCLVAGLYPNIATLMRPSREKRIRGGRLITKDGNVCRPSSGSFQCDRIKNASERGKDAYAVYHGKHLSVGVTDGSDERIKQEPFLSEVNFVSRFAILLFGGEIDVRGNCLVVDNWLKFKVDDVESKAEKVSDKGQVNVVLIRELRKELDRVMLRHIMKGRGRIGEEENKMDAECESVIQVVRKLLCEK